MCCTGLLAAAVMLTFSAVMNEVWAGTFAVSVVFSAIAYLLSPGGRRRRR